MMPAMLGERAWRNGTGVVLFGYVSLGKSTVC